MNKVTRLLTVAWDAIRYGYIHTHERANPHIPNATFDNHLKVYKFAAQFCSGQTVLDIGCGVGYGTDCLARSSKQTVGIDCSKSALRFARRRYQRDNLNFIRMSAEELDFPPRTFDFIISSENFEHLQDQEKAAREIARVLKPKGLCLLATPNPEAFVNTKTNPFHTHECTFEELRTLFSSVFYDVLILENQLSLRRDRGIVPDGVLSIFGRPASVEHLSNTHSFFCFLRNPK